MQPMRVPACCTHPSWIYTANGDTVSMLLWTLPLQTIRLYDASGIAHCTCPLQAPVLDGCLQDDSTCFAGQLDGSVTRYVALSAAGSMKFAACSSAGVLVKIGPAATNCHAACCCCLQVGLQHAAAGACGRACRRSQVHRVVGKQRCVATMQACQHTGSCPQSQQ